MLLDIFENKIVILNYLSKYFAKIFSVYQATRKYLSSRIDSADCKIDECTDNTIATRDEV